MFNLTQLSLGMLRRCFRSRGRLLLENLALRQQLAVLKRRRPRPKLNPLDRLFWVLARRFWCDWKKSLLVVTPETVVGWHRTGFQLYWSLISKERKRVGRQPLSSEVRELLFRMVAENPTWGAPRIHGELAMLGFDVSERTVSRWMKRAPRDPQPARRWFTFLRNHREVIAAMDFLAVPTLTFRLLYCFFIISHDRRQIVHFNVTRHPTSSWIVQQLREAFPYQSAPKFLVFDHDAKYGFAVPAALRSMQIGCVQTSIRSPWQNGVAERWVGSCRRELLDHVIALNEWHLKGLLSEYVSYYHEDRTHLGLGRERRNTELAAQSKVVCFPMIESAGCITVTIELPSSRAFPSILNIYRRAPGSDALVSRGPPNSPAPSLEENGWSGARWEFTLGRKRLATSSSDDILARHRSAA